MIKVADFGLAESIDPTKEYFRQNQDIIIKLPVKWLALESINDGVFSEKSDVVSVNLSSIIHLCQGILSVVTLGNTCNNFHPSSLCLVLPLYVPVGVYVRQGNGVE